MAQKRIEIYGYTDPKYGPMLWGKKMNPLETGVLDGDVTLGDYGARIYNAGAWRVMSEKEEISFFTKAARQRCAELELWETGLGWVTKARRWGWDEYVMSAPYPTPSLSVWSAVQETEMAS
jgi:hypothetical protein